MFFVFYFFRIWKQEKIRVVFIFIFYFLIFICHYFFWQVYLSLLDTFHHCHFLVLSHIIFCHQSLIPSIIATTQHLFIVVVTTQHYPLPPLSPQPRDPPLYWPLPHDILHHVSWVLTSLQPPSSTDTFHRCHKTSILYSH